MLNHLLVLLLVPVLRRLIAWLLVLMAAGFLVSVPARLWVRYVDRTPSEPMVIVLNAVSLCLLCVFGFRVTSRRRRRGWRGCRTG
jgi:hypothetical protein